MKTKINYLAIFTFYSIALVFRYLTNKTALLDGFSFSFLKVILQGVGPAIGALVVFSIFKLKPLMSLKGNYKNLLTPFILYWLLPIVLILTIEYFTKGTISYLAVISILVYSLLEEIGWRGFLKQELNTLPTFINCVIVAILWFVWHLNFDMTTSNLLFFGILILGAWGIGKVADRTHSLIAVAAFHALNNFFVELNLVKVAILIFLLTVWVLSLVIRKRQLNQNVQQTLG